MIAAVIGGAGSGKSAFAESLALKLCRKPPVYLATMINTGAEDEKIIKRHRKLRDGKGFITIEKAVRLYETQLPVCDTVLLEDVSNLIANEFFSCGHPILPQDAYNEAVHGMDFLAGYAENLVIVTSNVFEDGIRYDKFTEEYMETFGRLNMHIAEISDVFAETVCGLPVYYKGRPEGYTGGFAGI